MALSEIQAQIYNYVAITKEPFTPNTLVELTGGTRQLIMYHLSELVKKGAVKKIAYGAYEAEDTQKVIDALTYQPPSQVREAHLLSDSFVKTAELYDVLYSFVGTNEELSMLAKSLRKRMKDEITAAESSLRAFRGVVQDTSRSGKAAKKYRNDGYTPDKLIALVASFENVYGKLVKESDWQEKFK